MNLGVLGSTLTFGLSAIGGLVERPAQTPGSARPVNDRVDIDPILIARPRGSFLRELDAIEADLEKQLRA